MKYIFVCNKCSNVQITQHEKAMKTTFLINCQHAVDIKPYCCTNDFLIVNNGIVYLILSFDSYKSQIYCLNDKGLIILQQLEHNFNDIECK